MSHRGFTLVEVLVSVMIFSIVMTIALGALFSMSESDRRAEALKSVINNLNFALESMSRTIRTGYNYHCGTGGSDFATPAPQNCNGLNGTPAYDTFFAFRAADGSRVAYCLDDGAIKRAVAPAGAVSASCSSANFSPMTSPEVVVSTLRFIVTGACAKSGSGGCTADNIQPKVTVLLSGSVRVSASQTVPLNLEASIAQRVYDQ